MSSIAEGDIPLGRDTEYVTTYTPSLLRSIDRASQRVHIGLDEDTLPFTGEDVWTCYELSWLDAVGRPQAAMIELRVPCRSGAIVESKSLKLYLNSFAQTKFKNRTEVQSAIDSDLGLAFRAPVMVSIMDPDADPQTATQFPGVCLDNLPIEVDTYLPDASLLEVEKGEVVVKDAVYTNLFRSVCPITEQPDYATLFIEYAGPRITRESLLAYLVSYRRHAAFHEVTIEEIFSALRIAGRLERLTVYGRFMRRGGIDINPFRSTHDQVAPAVRLARQ